MGHDDKIDLNELFGDDDDDVGDPTGPEVVRRPVRSPTPASASNADVEAQHAALDALATVLPELREHLMRSVAWIDEVMDALSEVSRGR